MWVKCVALLQYLTFMSMPNSMWKNQDWGPAVGERKPQSTEALKGKNEIQKNRCGYYNIRDSDSSIHIPHSQVHLKIQDGGTYVPGSMMKGGRSCLSCRLRLSLGNCWSALPFILQWPKFSHRTTSSCRGGWKMWRWKRLIQCHPRRWKWIQETARNPCRGT